MLKYLRVTCITWDLFKHCSEGTLGGVNMDKNDCELWLR